jgi:hypothetical protein
MSTCILRNDIGEAFKWFLTMQDVVQIQPTEVTFYLMIPAAISDDKYVHTNIIHDNVTESFVCALSCTLKKCAFNVVDIYA